MKRPIFYIQENNAKFHVKMHDQNDLLLLVSKSFETYRECEKFVDILRVHMRFQTNFSRRKNIAGQYGFEIRTCWDDLIATSAWFNSRQDREDAMQAAFDANTDAVFVHKTMRPVADLSMASLQGVA
ncbi:MAG: hypothetical protein HOI49_11120 [Bacteroidetes bacterium]|jgi:uncharacterized protein YegP (UPF0339 family)|nr:hypothetical protein [Bacteroidota bacterium]